MSRLRVEVVWAERHRQALLEISLAEGATVRDAVAVAARRPEFAHVDVARTPVGIFGTLVRDLDQPLRDGDRVEFYRPLAADPMTARRRRAKREFSRGTRG